MGSRFAKISCWLDNDAVAAVGGAGAAVVHGIVLPAMLKLFTVVINTRAQVS
jgi:hypothetical protein